MRTAARWLVAAGVLALCGGSAMAQPPGGFGGFGGGGGVTNLRTALFSNKALQEELKITDEQATKLKEAGAKQAEALKPFMPAAPMGFGGGGGGGFGGGRGGFSPVARAPGDDDGALAFHKVQVKLIEERVALMKGALTADQQKRLSQLENQQLGTAAFTNARVAKALGLSDEVTKTFAEMNDGMNKEIQEMTQSAFQDGFDREKMQELQTKQRTLRTETVEKMAKSLTDDQKKKWKEMTGEAFDFTKLVPVRKDQ